MPAGPRSPFLRADDLGVLRGDGVFERFLVRGGQPRYFDQHLARLARSAKLAELAVPGPEAWRAGVALAIESWSGGPEWELRLVCTRGPEEGGAPSAYVLGQRLNGAVLRQRRDGVAVLTAARGLPVGLAQEAPWLMMGAKTLSYAVNMAARRWATSRGADDLIFVGTDGIVWEASGAAVVASYGRRLLSPPASLGILDSISVGQLFKAAAGSGWEVSRQELTVDALFEADGVWLTSSLRFARVHTLDDKVLPEAAAHAGLAALSGAG
jgi:4-amino-4-deoxychorismate lyase